MNMKMKLAKFSTLLILTAFIASIIVLIVGAVISINGMIIGGVIGLMGSAMIGMGKMIQCNTTIKEPKPAVTVTNPLPDV